MEVIVFSMSPGADHVIQSTNRDLAGFFNWPHTGRTFGKQKPFRHYRCHFGQRCQDDGHAAGPTIFGVTS